MNSLGMRHAAVRALVAVALGIGLARVVSAPVWVTLGAVGLGLGLAWWSRGLSLYAALVGASFVYAGSRRASPIRPETFAVRQFRGTVVEEPSRGAGLRYSLALASPLEGRVVLWLRDSMVRPGYGDELAVAARIRPLDLPRNPGLPDANRTLREQGVVGTAVAGSSEVTVVGRGRGSLWTRCVEMPVRRHVLRTVEQLLPEPEAALLAGLLVGGRQGLPDDAHQAFADSGIVHILAVSGMNVSIVVGTLWLLLGAIGIRGWWRFGIGAVVVLGYVSVAGFSAAPARAGIMALAVLFSVPVQRRVTALASLSAAGLALLVVDPATLFNTGAQLSFAATLGIVLATGRLEPALTRVRPRRLRAGLMALGISLAATIATAPLMLHRFFQVQPLAFLSSLVVAPLVALAMPLGLTLVLANLINAWAAAVFAGALWAVLWFLLRLTLLLGGLRWAMFCPGQLPWLGVFWAYAVSLAALHRSLRVLALMLFAVGANVFVWCAVVRRPVTQVVFLDPRGGDAVLLEDTLGRRVLLDAGIDRVGVVRDYLRCRGISRLDAVIITHPDRDHYGGLLDLDDRCRVGRVIIPAVVRAESGFTELLRTMRRRGAQVVPVTQGSRLTGCGFGCEFLWPDAAACRRYEQGLSSTNDVSLVVRVEHAGFTMLLTGDMESLELLPAPLLAADLLKSPHHGSRKGNRPELYQLVQPRYVVAMGRYPTPARLEARLTSPTVEYVNTRSDGGLTLRFANGQPALIRYR
jgi:competence protein ComEC